MAYAGQNFDMSVPAPARGLGDSAEVLDLAERFHDRHEADRGFSFRDQDPTVRGVRITALGRVTKPPSLAEVGDLTDAAAAQTGTRPVYFGDGFADTPGVRRVPLRPRRPGAGPRAGRGALHRGGGAAGGVAPPRRAHQLRALAGRVRPR